jgi:lipoic acid synthetase
MNDSRTVSIDAPVLPRLPPWLKRPMVASGTASTVERSVNVGGLHTVCVEAKCPNRGECFARGTATFLILGNTCTRKCGFCGIRHGAPMPLDKDEPRRVVEAIGRMGIRHAVVTSVTRDDCADGGAGQFADVVRRIHGELPGVSVEVLVPDFAGNQGALETVLQTQPEVFNHNIETVPRLYSIARPQAIYRRSLEILARAAEYKVRLKVKSGLMVGLGESFEEVGSTLAEMHDAGCSMVTIGQYLRPTQSQLAVVEFVTPERFNDYRDVALSIGFTEVSSAPFVRSSYKAAEFLANGFQRKEA